MPEANLNQQDLAVLRQVVQSNSQLLAHFSEEDRTLLDVNHDGQVDEKDIQALCVKLMGIDVTHPAGTTEKLTHLRAKLR